MRATIPSDDAPTRFSQTPNVSLFYCPRLLSDLPWWLAT
jgi:hypothetical protein